jgi:hypothetical protein
LFDKSKGDKVDKHLYLDDVLSYLDHNIEEIKRGERKFIEKKNILP